MNRYDDIHVRERGKTLLIVEGFHEKDVLFNKLFKVFPELDITDDNIIIYRTNIYNLYEKLVKEYGEYWYEDDIDLPLYVAELRGYDKTLYTKNNFRNIIIVFDYEPQDTYFDKEKILNMQKCFGDVSDNGQLYINYPMVESYMDIEDLSDDSYMNYKISADIKKGNIYKLSVEKRPMFLLVDMSRKLKDILTERFGLSEEVATEIITGVLVASDEDTILSIMSDKLRGHIKENDTKTCINQFLHIIKEKGYLQKGVNYWEHLRNVFKRVIMLNLNKANNIQSGEQTEISDIIEELDYYKILQEQNKCYDSLTEGFIWVLNTSVLMVAEYNSTLLQ